MTVRFAKLTIPAIVTSLAVCAGSASAQIGAPQYDDDRQQIQRDQLRTQQERDLQRLGPDERQMQLDRELRQRPTLDQQQFDQRNGLQREMPQRGQITGEILQLREVDVPTSREPHAVALMETERGHRIAVDLGPADELRTDLQPGDQATVEGHLIQIGQQRLLLGEQLRANGRTERIVRRPEMMDPRMQQQMQMPQRQQLSGEIDQIRRVQIPGLPEDSVFAVVRLERDQGQITANLGSERQLQRLDLRRGDRVQISGQLIEVQDRPMLIAEQVQTREGTVHLRERTRQLQEFRDQREDRDRYRDDFGLRDEFRMQDDLRTRDDFRARPQFQDPQRMRAQERGGLGVSVVPGRREGVQVVEVYRGSPAEQAGIREGDHILEIDQQPTDTPGRLVNIIARKDPQRQVQITILRNGRVQRLSTMLTTRRDALTEDPRDSEMRLYGPEPGRPERDQYQRDQFQRDQLQRDQFQRDRLQNDQYRY
jgi:hypothetical protein